MTGRILLLGMIAGLIAGILAFGTARVWGEPPVAAAIAIEEAGAAEPAAHSHGTDAEAGAHVHADAAPAVPAAQGTQGAAAGFEAGDSAAAAHSHSHNDEAEGGFSRATQAGIGLLTGTAVYGAALGGLVALVFAVVQGRVSALSPRATAGVIALAGFVAVVLVPQLKYPANPPAVGHGETIGLRTAMFFLMLAISVAAMVLAVLVARGNPDRWRGALTGAAIYGGVVLAAGLLLPRIDEVPAGFPADVLWQFRTASLLVEAVLWGGVGLIFGWLVERPQGRRLALA